MEMRDSSPVSVVESEGGKNLAAAMVMGGRGGWWVWVSGRVGKSGRDGSFVRVGGGGRRLLKKFCCCFSDALRKVGWFGGLRSLWAWLRGGGGRRPWKGEGSARVGVDWWMRRGCSGLKDGLFGVQSISSPSSSSSGGGVGDW